MRIKLFDQIARAFGKPEKLHPLDRQMAKYWVKRRLVALYPELSSNPSALEAAYQSLNLEPRPGTEEGDHDTVFEMKLPRGH